eukprot:XP_022265764.1 centrosomal protein of 44 kDa isoform X4 [Canis lupus familiaris]
MATGDLKRSLRNLEQVLRMLNYPQEVDCVGLVKGDTAASLPIISYSLTSYSPYIAELLMESNIELIAKNDLRFVDTVYKKKAVVIRHLYNEDGLNIPEDTISTVTDVREAFDVCDLKTTEIKVPEVKFLEIKSEQQDIRINPEITALQTMLTECQEKLQKLALVESRLESLEEKMKGKVMVNEKTWTNLLSRVTLLETEMLLSKKNNEYIDFSELNEDYESSNDIDILNPDRKSKERQTSIPLSSGYSTVSSDSTPRTSSTSYCGLKENSEIQRERERGRDTGRGRSRLHAPGARRGIRSRVSRIAPWAKGRRQTAAPPRDPQN